MVLKCPLWLIQATLGPFPLGAVQTGHTRNLDRVIWLIRVFLNPETFDLVFGCGLTPGSGGFAFPLKLPPRVPTPKKVAPPNKFSMDLFLVFNGICGFHHDQFLAQDWSRAWGPQPALCGAILFLSGVLCSAAGIGGGVV